MSRAPTLSLGAMTSRESAAPLAARPESSSAPCVFLRWDVTEVAVGLLVLVFGVLKLGALAVSARATPWSTRAKTMRSMVLKV